MSRVRFDQIKTEVCKIRDQFNDRYRGPIQATWNTTLLAVAREFIEDREERERRAEADGEP
jgi:hypothetical protein